MGKVRVPTRAPRGRPDSRSADPAPARGPAPRWLRGLVLGGLGLLLALPAVVALATGQWGGDRTAAGEAAQKFLDAIHDRDRETLTSLLLSAQDPDRATMTMAHLMLPVVRARIDNVVLQDSNNATAYYTLRLADAKDESSLNAVDPAILPALRGMAGEWAGQKGSLVMRRQEGRWRVRGFTFPINETGTGPTVLWDPADAKAPAVAAAAGPFREFDALAPLGPREWEASWQTDLDMKDVPARAVLQDLARKLELPLSFGPSPGRAPEPQFPPSRLDQPVSLHLRGRSRLEAIEDVCRQIGAQARYDASGVHVVAGPRAGPVAFAGPFLVEPAEVKEFGPQPTGALRLRFVTARSLAPFTAVLGPFTALRAAGTSACPIDAAVAADGTDLYHAANQAFYDSGRTRGGLAGLAFSDGVGTASQKELLEESHAVPLRNLLRDLDAIHQVRGRYVVPLPVAVDVIRFDRLVPGAAGQAGDVRLTFRQMGMPRQRGDDPGDGPMELAPAGVGRPRGWPTVALFDAEGLEGKRLAFAAFDAQGKPLKCGMANTSRHGLVRVDVEIGGAIGAGAALNPPVSPGPARPADSGEPAALVFKAVSLKEVVCPFELRDVPLRQRPPRRIEPARFPGHEAPVSVAFDKVISPGGRSGAPLPALRPFVTVTLTLQNHSQKEVESVRVKLAYQDAAGRPLGETVRTAARVEPVADRLAVLPPGPITVEEPELPDGAVKATVTVLAVGFTDGTSWPP